MIEVACSTRPMSANACARQTVPTGVSPIASNAAQSVRAFAGSPCTIKTVARMRRARAERGSAAHDSIEQLERAAEIMTVLQDVGLQQQQRRRDVWLGEPRLQHRFGAPEIPRLALGSRLVDVARCHPLRHLRLMFGPLQLFLRMPGGLLVFGSGQLQHHVLAIGRAKSLRPLRSVPCWQQRQQGKPVDDPIPQWSSTPDRRPRDHSLPCLSTRGPPPRRAATRDDAANVVVAKSAKRGLARRHRQRQGPAGAQAFRIGGGNGNRRGSGSTRLRCQQQGSLATVTADRNARHPAPAPDSTSSPLRAAPTASVSASLT